MMPEVEKVLKGVECCRMSGMNCEYCPYNSVSMYCDECQPKLVTDIIKVIRSYTYPDTDWKMVSVEDVLETVRDMAHHPDHVFVASELMEELERRLMKK